MGWVTAEDNVGWLVAPNTPVSPRMNMWLGANKQETRNLLDWPKQTDSASCGPLAMAAVSCALQGLKPTRQNMNAPGNWTEDSAIALRSSIAGWFFSHATQQGDRGRFEIDFVWRTPGFAEYVQPWMLSAGAVEQAFISRR